MRSDKLLYVLYDGERDFGETERLQVMQKMSTTFIANCPSFSVFDLVRNEHAPREYFLFFV